MKNVLVQAIFSAQLQTIREVVYFLMWAKFSKVLQVLHLGVPYQVRLAGNSGLGEAVVLQHRVDHGNIVAELVLQRVLGVLERSLQRGGVLHVPVVLVI